MRVFFRFLENRPEFVRLETVRPLLTAVAVVASGSWFGGVHDPRSSAGFAALYLMSAAALTLAARIETKRAATAIAA